MQISIDEALERVTRAMVGARVSEENARAVAQALVLAEASGQGGHGLRRLPSYRAQSLSGKVDGFARPTCDRPRPGVLRIDAGLGFAYPALDLALRELPGMAKACGIAIAAIRRSHHAGGIVRLFLFGGALGLCRSLWAEPFSHARPKAERVSPGMPV